MAIVCACLPVSLTAQPALPGSQSPAATLPLLGDGSAMASAEERRLGDRIAREIFRDPDYLDDPVLADYVQSVWQPLLVAARARGDLTPELDERFAWRIMLGRDRTVNAFALPGGYLGVNLGLLAVVNSRDELASVLGHELSHVTQRHISRLIAKDSAQAPWLLGAMILGALAASKSPDAASALMVGGQAVAAQNQLNFSRDMEREADRIGFGVMTQAGFEAAGFVTMFDKLQQAARLNDSGGYPYLRSHPLTTERIADMQSRLPLGAPHAVAGTPLMRHALMATRAKVLSNPGVDALRTWQAQVDDPGLRLLPAAQQAGALYGATLAALQLRDMDLARRNLTRLQALAALDTGSAEPVRWLGAEIDLTARDLTPAQLTALATRVGVLDAKTTAVANMRRPELMLQAQVALQLNQSAALSSVTQSLQTWLATQPQDALAWQALASMYNAQQQSLRALRAEAEAQAARLDYTGAMDRLRAAQDLMRANEAAGSSADHIDASIIDTRQRQIEVLLKQQAQQALDR
ncbi:MAG: peptidase M48 [Rhodoferax ferrireducens]|uniref:Peptidase M48 n=2 Tax=Pseudomonadota TaxID=1224 RepID=A0A1Y1R0F9_9GAMM|nr:MAG: peptidase M48 [Rhodoferax ferrireducens]OQX17488.1 MAG: peptidase M48 [Thiothrix lacustris]